MRTAIGMVEISSIAIGMRALDAMLKTAAVDLVDAYPVDPGKYLAMVAGDVAAVQAATAAGRAAAGQALIDSVVIANLHPQVVPALGGQSGVSDLQALGIIETFTAASAVKAGDTAVKAAAVKLVEIRLARDIAGKAFITLTGDVGSVQAAVEAAAEVAAAQGLLLATVVIPRPHDDMRKAVL